MHSIRARSFFRASLALGCAALAFHAPLVARAQTKAGGPASETTPFTLTEPVSVEGGKLVGYVVAGDPSIQIYRGIPFAAPPLGDLRWKAPAPVVPWEGVRQCLEDGAACVQTRPPLAVPGLAPKVTSEDCLFLNVFAPPVAPGERLPVMVWIHGGGFIMGSGGGAMYDGTSFARRGVILVSINYRLGALGYMGHPALSKESPEGVSGNYGLLDQIAALDWVKKNIAAFGGDPSRVTIFGESAGSISVSMLMVSPLAKGLFSGAIAQSGGAYGIMNRHLRESWYGIPSVESYGERIAEKLGVAGEKDVAAALRAKTADEILKATVSRSEISPGLISADNFPFWPTVDGHVIPDEPGQMFEEGKQHAVPFVAGSNADEGTLFLMMFPSKDTSVYEPLAKKMFGAYAPDVLARYPATTPEEMKESLNRILTDLAFLTPARLMIRSMEKKGAPGFLYHFRKTHEKGFGASLGAHHAAEIPYVFGTLDALKVGDDADRALSEQMIAYWSNFARTGNPNGEGLVQWPIYDEHTDVHLDFDVEVKQDSHLRQEDTRLMERIMSEAREKRREVESAVGE